MDGAGAGFRKERGAALAQRGAAGTRPPLGCGTARRAYNREGSPGTHRGRPPLRRAGQDSWDLRAPARARAVVISDSDGHRELVSKLLHLHFKDHKTKVSGDALQLMVELLKIFVVEAAVRGVRQAQAEDVGLVDVDQLEKLLDF